MDDDLESEVLIKTYRTYISHMKLLSKFCMATFSNNKPVNSTLSWIWRIIRVYLLKPEVFFIGIIICMLLFYLQAAELWHRGILAKISSAFGVTKGARSAKSGLLFSAAEKQSWEEKKEFSSVYAIQGRRPRMEDRFVIDENINNDTGVAIFAIFDGHGGEFAADFAKDILIQNLYNKIIEASQFVKNKKANANEEDKEGDNNDDDVKCLKKPEKPEPESVLLQRKQSLNNKKGTSKTEDFLDSKKSAQQGNQIDNDILKQFAASRPITRESLSKYKNSNIDTGPANPPPRTMEAKCYVENGTKINFGKLITDEVLAADYKLVEKAKQQSNVAGTTALIAILNGTKLTVANVGDSRAVMCDSKGNAVPLSFDHKPQQMREHKRIQEAGGFIAFKGVWRVAGILATSRALGDYPLKDKNLVIADPDILSFDLTDHKPLFIILASDGLFDTFSNEEAVAYIKDRLDEPHYGAKSITLQSYSRGSVDNISTIVIRFKNGRYDIGTSA